MSQYTADYIRYTWQMLNGFRADHERSLAGMRARDVGDQLASQHPLDILDLANGRLRPQFALLKAAGHRIYGVDYVNRPATSPINMAYGIARQLYRWKLELPPDAMSDHTLLCGNVGRLPFANNSFDLVTSIAAFEHFLDVPSVVAEIHRVLRPGGLVWVCVHLFTAPSGGHNLSFAQLPLRTLPLGIEPWDHLRLRQLRFHVPLNEWRMHQYIAEFENHLELLKSYCALREGEHLLTPAIEAELSQYTRDELTCWAYVLVARKPAE